MLKKATRLYFFIAIIVAISAVTFWRISVNMSANKANSLNAVQSNEKVPKAEQLNLEEENGYIKCTIQRAVLWVEKDYLNDDEIKEMADRIDKGINKAEEYIGIKLDEQYTIDNKIHYYIKDGNFRSYAEAEKGIAHLSHAKDKLSPYIHEAIHIIAKDWYATWLHEGLAVHLNDRLEGWPSYPNFGTDVDELSRNYINGEFDNILKLVGDNTFISGFGSEKERMAFYILSGSFVRFLDNNLGTDQLMKIYAAEDPIAEIQSATGKSMEEWKKMWIDGLLK